MSRVKAQKTLLGWREERVGVEVECEGRVSTAVSSNWKKRWEMVGLTHRLGQREHQAKKKGRKEKVKVQAGKSCQFERERAARRALFRVKAVTETLGDSETAVQE